MSAAAGEAEQTATTPFPWKEALHAGLSLLRIDAARFWAMTPRELHAATGALAARTAAPGRAALAALMARYPDHPKNNAGAGHDDG